MANHHISLDERIASAAAQNKTLRRLDALMICKADLLSDHTMDSKPPYTMCTQEVVQALLNRDLYDRALELGHLYEMDLSETFEKLAMKYISLVASEESWDVIHNVGKYLEDMLKRYDSQNTNYKYRKAVARGMLRAAPELELPLWLVASFKSKHPEDLLRIYVNMKMYETAVDYCIWYIRHEQNSVAMITVRPGLRWICRSAIDKLQNGLEVTGRKDLAKMVRDQMQEYDEIEAREKRELIRDYQHERNRDDILMM
ncbi:hypothetical protein HDU85_006699 [Gaertneriomyces sp. JEL0708]|nr:hypothetical protein HDU85_006699 [Gaertneriomyces sp. JEL0708]